ncbi:MAG: SPRY domain-containing protein [Chloroflexota bacterium]|nr:SPRY domain-containing protein [Chloroflexota bacterium]
MSSPLGENQLIGASGNQAKDYEIEYSCRFDETTSTALSRTPTSNGNSQVATFSAWVKYDLTYAVFWDVGVAGGGSTQDAFQFGFNSDGTCFTSEQNNNSGRYDGKTTAQYRDPSAWYHVHFIINTPHATASERIKIYVNGVYKSGTYNYPSQNASLNMNLTSHVMRLGAGARTGGALYNEYSGLIAEAHWLDGQAIGPENFGETDAAYGHWKPIEYTGGNYGTNGVYFKFDNASALGADSSGNGNNYTLTNMGAVDQMIDTPTNNFCVWNGASTTATYAEANTKVTTAVSGSAPYQQAIYGSMQIPTSSGGKWYWEVDVINVAGLLGIGASCTESTNQNRHNQVGGVAGVNIYVENGNAYIGGTTYGSQPTYGVGDIISVAVDEDNNKIYFAKNNTWLNSANPSAGTNGWTINTSNSTGFVTAAIHNDSVGSNVGVTANFGQDSSFAGDKTAQGNTDGNGKGDFYYTPPTGFLALCTDNLAAPTVKPKDHFKPLIYEGGSGAQTISVGFAPDIIWLKNRGQSQQWSQWDSVRGVNKLLSSDRTTAETSESNMLNAFTSNGFTHGSDSLVAAGNSYAAFNWKAGGAASNNTVGDITSSVSVNQAAGISIVTYTGNGNNAQTVGHGLGVSPSLMIVRPRNYADHWFVYHAYMGATKYYYLDAGNPFFTSNIAWSNTDPTSSVFTIGTSSPATGGGQTYNYIAYCFAEVKGFSQFGKYVGNNNVNGPFVYTGFRPAFVFIKSAIDSNNLAGLIVDSVRSYGWNDDTGWVQPSETAGEYQSSPYHEFDLLSNGFKVRNTGSSANRSGETYVYMAFAEYPITKTNAR